MLSSVTQVHVLLWCLMCWRYSSAQFSGCPAEVTFYITKGLSIYHSQLEVGVKASIFIYYQKTVPFFCNSSTIEENNHLLLKEIQVTACQNASQDCYFPYETTIAGFYCAVMLFPNCELSYYTDTLHILDDGHKTYGISKAFQKILIPLLAVLGVVIFIGVVIYKMCMRKARNTSRDSLKDAESLLASHRIESSVKSVKNDKVTILIFYWSDDWNHLNAVQEFVKKIEDVLNCTIAVYYRSKDDISRVGVANWVNNMIHKANKIIVISSEGAFFHDTTISDNDNEANNVFRYGWRYIISNPNLCQDYNKVLHVRFEHTLPSHMLPLIVPNRHFVIETHFEELIQNIRSNMRLSCKVNVPKQV